MKSDADHAASTPEIEAADHAAADEPSADQPSADEPSLIELVLAEHAARTQTEAEAEPEPALPSRIDGVLVGRVAAVSESGEIVVAFDGGPERGVIARAMQAVGAGDVGRDVALLFEAGDPARPVVMGFMHTPPKSGAGLHVESSGERVVLSAEKEIVLRCGKASITLTRAGKILIRGEYLLARSSGVNRIQGGSVQIN